MIEYRIGEVFMTNSLLKLDSRNDHAIALHTHYHTEDIP
jgi:hypothetical protein